MKALGVVQIIVKAISADSQAFSRNPSSHLVPHVGLDDHNIFVPLVLSAGWVKTPKLQFSKNTV